MNKSIQILEFIGSSTRQLRMVLVVIKCRRGEDVRPLCRRSPARRAGCRRASRRRWEARCCGRAGRRSAATLPAASPAKEETNQPQIQYPNRRKQACNRSRTANICLFFPASLFVCSAPFRSTKNPTKTSLPITSPSHRNIKCSKWPRHGVLNVCK